MSEDSLNLEKQVYNFIRCAQTFFPNGILTVFEYKGQAYPAMREQLAVINDRLLVRMNKLQPYPIKGSFLERLLEKAIPRSIVKLDDSIELANTISFSACFHNNYLTRVSMEEDSYISDNISLT